MQNGSAASILALGFLWGQISLNVPLIFNLLSQSCGQIIARMMMVMTPFSIALMLLTPLFTCQGSQPKRPSSPFTLPKAFLHLFYIAFLDPAASCSAWFLKPMGCVFCRFNSCLPSPQMFTFSPCCL